MEVNRLYGYNIHIRNGDPALHLLSIGPDSVLLQLILPDLSLSRQAWDGMLDDWESGIGAENAKQMSSSFERYMNE